MSTATQFDTSTETTQAPSRIHPAFDWVRSQHIPSLNLVMEEYRHRKTGAQHFHLASDNPENVFLVAFRTLPMDSSGVAHVLEHTVLCGSEKYPVRDPFFMMIRRSLNTFMNAMTSSDWTAYPFATRNRKDFNNLLDVYLDSVFFSRLHELDFAQEGHRLEFADPEDPDSDLEFRGVVYNEMKGAMSSTGARLFQTMSKYLFPTTTYHFNNGGEPDEIPDLDYGKLKSFYETHYHPSNAIFMTYGDMPAYEHHEKFEEKALSRFEAQNLRFLVPDEKRYLAPVRVEEYYPLDEEDADYKTHIVLGWLLGQSTDLEELFKAQLLTDVLLDNSSSPLLKALETTDLGKAPSPLCGVEDNNREMSFFCGLEGCATDATGQVENLILETLKQVAEQGVPQSRVEAALHQLELHQREISGDGTPYGLHLAMAGLSTAVHGGDPIRLLDIDPVVAQLREEIKNPAFISDLIHRLLLDNPHRVVLTLKPDNDLPRRQAETEARRLRRIRESLDEEQRQEIIQRSQALAERQQAEDDPSMLPKVGLEDVPPEIPVYTPERSTLEGDGSEVSFYAQGTNGLAYQQIVVELPQLDEELLEVLPWYSSCVTELGIGEMGYDEVQAWQSAVSGGISCQLNMRSDVEDEQKHRTIVVFSGKALQDRHGDLTELLHATFFRCRFDENQRLRELLEQINARQQHSITGRGHRLAVNLASSGMSPVAGLTHRFGGLEGVRRLKQLNERFDQEKTIEDLLERFRRIHEQLQQAPRQFLLIGEGEHQSSLQDDLQRQWRGADTPRREAFQPLQLPATREKIAEVWTTSTQVNFCAKAFPSVPAGHPDHAPLCVLASLMGSHFLHNAVREQGGAYGSGADQDPNSASFRFFSYRDPRLSGTLEDFDRAVDWVLNEEHPWWQIEEAILGVISNMDRTTSPAGAARQAFYNELFGNTPERRMAFRRGVLDVDLEQLRAVARQYLQTGQASIGVVSNAAETVPEGVKVEKL